LAGCCGWGGRGGGKKHAGEGKKPVLELWFRRRENFGGRLKTSGKTDGRGTL